jgi:hypothetical protein
VVRIAHTLVTQTITPSILRLRGFTNRLFIGARIAMSYFLMAHFSMTRLTASLLASAGLLLSLSAAAQNTVTTPVVPAVATAPAVAPAVPAAPVAAPAAPAPKAEAAPAPKAEKKAKKSKKKKAKKSKA